MTSFTEIPLSSKAPPISDALYAYAANHCGVEHPLLIELRQKTLALPAGGMISSVEQVRLIQLLIQLINAKRVLEIGTFTGYTSLAMGMALPNAGTVITLDIDEQAPKLGMDYWQQANVADKIVFKSGRALELLDTLNDSTLFDLAYIDADKKNNRHYYEKLLPMLRTNGLLIIDNVLWKGKVIDETVQDEQTQSIREFNDFVAKDLRVDSVLLLLGDGLTIARKKECHS